MNFPERIETERLILRPWTENDAEECYRYTQDPDVGPRAGWPVHTSVENAREIIRDVLMVPGTYAIELKETGLAIGTVGIKTGDSSNAVTNAREAEIGCWLGKAHWGKGYMPEAVSAAIDVCFNQLGYQKMWYCFYDGNTQSKRVSEKCGFTYDHTVNNVDVPLLGEKRTEYFCSLKKKAGDREFLAGDMVQHLKTDVPL